MRISNEIKNQLLLMEFNALINVLFKLNELF